jgi:hypothetical protein
VLFDRFMLIKEKRLGVGAVDRGVATRRPASAEGEERLMVYVADIDAARPGRPLHLGVTSEAHTGIAHGQQFGVDGTVRLVATGATFTQSRMFKNDGLGLFSVALGATFVQAAHRQSAGRFHDVHAMRIMALDAIHFAFED